MSWRYEKGLHELGNGNYAYLVPDGSWGWSNAGLVADGGQSLLIDTLFDLKMTGEMLQAMRRAVPAAKRIGALVNNLMFLAFMGYTADGDGNAWTRIVEMVRENLVPIAIDGYKFWPAVSLAGFMWVPVDKRVVFGSTAGILWGVWLSLMVKA